MNEYTYEVITVDSGSTFIKRTDANGTEAWIPQDNANADYQAYLASLEETTDVSS